MCAAWRRPTRAPGTRKSQRKVRQGRPTSQTRQSASQQQLGFCIRQSEGTRLRCSGQPQVAATGLRTPRATLPGRLQIRPPGRESSRRDRNFGGPKTPLASQLDAIAAKWPIQPNQRLTQLDLVNQQLGRRVPQALGSFRKGHSRGQESHTLPDPQRFARSSITTGDLHPEGFCLPRGPHFF